MDFHRRVRQGYLKLAQREPGEVAHHRRPSSSGRDFAARLAAGGVDAAGVRAGKGLDMHRVRLIHWKAAEAAECVELLHNAGYEVVYRAMDGSADLKELVEDPTDAVVIDLGRLPSHGRDIGLYLRERKSTRHVPLIFAGGDPQKVERIRELLPDAAYASWDGIDTSLKSAIGQRPG